MSKVKFRPAARILSSIGEDLIQDKIAAVVELVKNAYDADSKEVTIAINKSNIVIADKGDGMSYNDIINKWIIPATSDKIENPVSKLGRKKQGRKGIGRYASMLLGDNLHLKSITATGELTEININWKDLEKFEFLDQYEFDVVQGKSNAKDKGVVLDILFDETECWTDKDNDDLQKELKKLIPPFIKDDDFSFEIILNNNSVTPFPLMNVYDYRIFGKIYNNGSYDLEYANGRDGLNVIEQIRDEYIKPTECGDVEIDIRIYDRERWALEATSNKLDTDYGTAKNILDENNGIGVYRNGFRIRPLGDSDYDWLSLDEKRVQDPSHKIGRNQAIGFIQIQDEEISGLKETSARDGIKNNDNYEGLISTVNKCIKILEIRRFDFRKLKGIMRIPKSKIVAPVIEELDSKVSTKLNKTNASAETKEAVSYEIKEYGKKVEKVFNELELKVAIYESQANLGNMVDLIIHEAKDPISYLINHIPLLNENIDSYISTKDLYYKGKINKTEDGLITNGNYISDLLNRISPLTVQKRGSETSFPVYHEIDIAFKIFENQLNEFEIDFVNNVNKNIIIKGWKIDILAIFKNLIDNSIYWLNYGKTRNKKIEVSSTGGSDDFIISYKNNGISIPDKYLKDGNLFIPRITGKNNGTGLGLAIAGESANRSSLQLKAIKQSQGVLFTLSKNQGENNDEV
jgi:hypothetical protein